MIKFFAKKHQKLYENANPAIFVNKNLNINILKIKKRKIRSHCHYTVEYRDAAEIIA